MSLTNLSLQASFYFQKSAHEKNIERRLVKRLQLLLHHKTVKKSICVERNHWLEFKDVDKKIFRKVVTHCCLSHLQQIYLTILNLNPESISKAMIL